MIKFRNKKISLKTSYFRFETGFVFLIILNLACVQRPSIIEISPKDREVFKTILDRPAEEIRFFETYDHLSIACTVVRPDLQLPRGVVGFIHGIAARSRLYLPLADSLAAHGFLVYLMDIRGHGFSQGESGSVPSDTAIFNDVTRFYRFVRKSVSPDLPFIAMGHSLGTYIWVSTLSLKSEIKPDAIVLISGGALPGASLNQTTKPENGDFIRIHKAALICSIFSPHAKPVEIVLPEEPQLKTSGFVTRYTLRFLRNPFINDDVFIDFYEHVNIPLLFIIGDSDEIFSVSLLKDVRKLVNSQDCELKIIPETTHTSIIWDGSPEIVKWLKKYF